MQTAKKTKAPAGEIAEAFNAKNPDLIQGVSTMDANPQPAITAIPGFHIPSEARAVLVTTSGAGFKCKPVAHDASVLNIERDLTDHLDARPYSDDWLLNLRHYIDQRLKARSEARLTSGVSMARGDGWNIVHL